MVMLYFHRNWVNCDVTVTKQNPLRGLISAAHYHCCCETDQEHSCLVCKFNYELQVRQ